MRIALGQLKINWENKDANLEKLKVCLEDLAGTRIDLLLLPEMSLTGFSMNTEKTKEREKETVCRVRKLAEAYHTAIGTGWVKDTGEFCENHYSVISADGELLDYAKLHPFSYGEESLHFKGGGTLPVCSLRNFQIGVQICYDLRFPEPFQILSKSAELIVVPANWPSARREHWDTLLRARAIENQVYIAGVNCAGSMGGQYYSGDSIVYAPDGTAVPAKRRNVPDNEQIPEEAIFLLEIDNNITKYREEFPVKKDRREELYRKLGST